MRIFGLNITRDDDKPKKSWYLKGYERFRGVGHKVAKVARLFAPGIVVQATETLNNKYVSDRRKRDKTKSTDKYEAAAAAGKFHKGGADDPLMSFKF
jgi:hypothetical protein